MKPAANLPAAEVAGVDTTAAPAEGAEVDPHAGRRASVSVAADVAAKPVDLRMTQAAAASFLVSLLPLGTLVLTLLSMQVVQEITIPQGVLLLLLLVGGMTAGNIACARLVTRAAACKPLAIASGLTLIAGVVALSAIGPNTTHADLAWRLALTGVAAGMVQRMFGLHQLVCASAAGVRDPKRMMWITQLAGAVLGIGLFAASFTYWLAPQLPRHVPLLPGERAHQLELAQAQREATNAEALRARVNSVLDGRLVVIERAYRGDQAAAMEILADVRTPEAMKASLRDGGIRARVHRYITERASHIEARLLAGEEGRNQLLNDPLLPVGFKQQIANVPQRAFLDEGSAARVATLFRDAILAREDDLVVATTEHSLRTVRAAASLHAAELVERIQQGLKLAFAAAIARTFQAGAWIIALAVLIVTLLPTSAGAREAG